MARVRTQASAARTKTSAVRTKTSAARTKTSAARTKTSAVRTKTSAVRTGSPGLGAVRAALAAADPAAALLATLAWWRAEPTPPTADLLDAISRRVSGSVSDETNWAKLARTRDPLVLGRLLAGLDGLSASFLPTAAALLEGFAPDPRITGALGAWALDPPTTSSSTYPFWTKAFDIAIATGDRRLIAPFGKRLAMPRGRSQFWPKFYAALERVTAKLDELPKGEAQPELAALRAAAERLPRLDELRASGIVAAAAKPREAPVLAGPLLAQARAHLAAGRVATAIDALLVHWRAERVPEIADLIERANRLLPAWDRPLAPDDKAMHAAWEAAFAERGARMPQLLENIAVGPAKELELRLVDLANLPDDPRISMRLAQLARGSRVSPERTQFWRSVFELLHRHRDARVVDALLREFDSFRGRYYNHHRQGRRILGWHEARPAAPSLGADDAKLATALAEELAAAERTARTRERELLASIAEARDDDGPRAVYADWLLEQGHPRGALMNGDRSVAETPHLFGVLDDIGDVRHDRGVPRALVVRWDTSGLLFRELAAHPLLAVLETIRFDADAKDLRQPVAAEIAPMLAAATNLAAVENLAGPLADELAALTSFERRGRQLVRQR